MRFSVAVFVAFVAAATAQSVADLPNCVQSCITGAPVAACGTTTSETALAQCICTNTDVKTLVETCATTSCTAEELQTALTVEQSMCATFATSSATDGGATATGGASDTVAPTDSTSESVSSTGTGAAGTGSSTTRTSGSTTTRTSAVPTTTTSTTPADGAANVGASIAAVFGAVAVLML